MVFLGAGLAEAAGASVRELAEGAEAAGALDSVAFDLLLGLLLGGVPALAFSPSPAAVSVFFLRVFFGVDSTAAEVSDAAASEAPAAFLLLLDFLVDLAAVEVSAVVVSEAPAAFLLLLDFFVDLAGVSVSAAAALEVVAAFLLFVLVDLLAVSLAADLSAAAVAFVAFFLDFFVVLELVVSLEPVCALAKAGEMATVSSRQKASAHSVTLCLE